jgi:hypothetical protein
VFDVYKHRTNSEYRLIVRNGSVLPLELVEDWELVEVIHEIETGVEKEIGECGYHLYKMEAHRPGWQ